MKLRTANRITAAVLALAAGALLGMAAMAHSQEPATDTAKVEHKLACWDKYTALNLAAVRVASVSDTAAEADFYFSIAQQSASSLGVVIAWEPADKAAQLCKPTRLAAVEKRAADWSALASRIFADRERNRERDLERLLDEVLRHGLGR